MTLYNTIPCMYLILLVLLMVLVLGPQYWVKAVLNRYNRKAMKRISPAQVANLPGIFWIDYSYRLSTLR